MRRSRPFRSNQGYIGIELAGLLGEAAIEVALAISTSAAGFGASSFTQRPQTGVSQIEVFMGQHFCRPVPHTRCGIQ